MNKNILLIIFILVSCARNVPKESVHKSLQSISIKEGEISNISKDDVIKAIHFVPLETTDSCLIDVVEKIDVFEEKIYVLDKKENLYVFDINGRFIKGIGQKGPGPDEYIGAHDFYIHPEKRYISLLCYSNRTAVRYNLNGDYLERFKMNIETKALIGNCCLIDSDNLWLENSNSTKWAPYQYICLLEKDMQENNTFFPWLSTGSESCSRPFPTNDCMGKEFYAISLLNDTVYKWDDNHFSPEYILESGLLHPTPEFVKANEPYEFIDEAEKKLNQQGYSKGLSRLFSTDNYLCLEYWGLGYFDMIFMDKKQKRNALYRFSGGNNNLLHVYNDLRCIYEKYLVREITVEMLYAIKEEVRACHHPEISDLYEKLNEDDNPVILLYDIEKMISCLK